MLLTLDGLNDPDCDIQDTVAVDTVVTTASFDDDELCADKE